MKGVRQISCCLSGLLSTFDFGETLWIEWQGRLGCGLDSSGVFCRMEGNLSRTVFFWVCQQIRTVRSAPEMVSAIFGQASTLTVLQLDGSRYISSKVIQQFLCTAPDLRKFHLLGWSRTKESPDHCLNVADAVQSDWVCLDLEVFGCAIKGIPRPDITLWFLHGPSRRCPPNGWTLSLLTRNVYEDTKACLIKAAHKQRPVISLTNTEQNWFAEH